MDYNSIIQHYYKKDSDIYRILYTHSRCVADMALEIVNRHPELHADPAFVEEAAMVHDIGIFRCHAPAIACFGTEPYICHGTIGAEIMREEGFPRHALVCERHTGAGLTLNDIISQQLPIPHRDLTPQSIEEKIVCFADKFFSKTRLEERKTMEQAVNSLRKFGDEGVNRFLSWGEMFL